MEEEGTEILFRPRTETILTKHFTSQGKEGNNDRPNLLQYCTIKETDDAKLNRAVPSTPSRIGEGEGEEKSSSASSSSPSTKLEQRVESTTNRAFFPVSTRAQPSRPALNRHESLVEKGTTDEDDGSISSDQDDSSEENSNKYHPALKAAIYTEGQEAVWHEDEYSTISSIYVKPEKNTTFALPACSQNSRKKIKIPFFKSRGKNTQKEQPISEVVEPTPRSVKIHIKKKKIAKSVLLLPPKEAWVETTEEREDNNNNEKERLMKENERYESITENSIQARRLLDTALSRDGLDEVQSERVAKEAFNHATIARRLSHHGKNNEMKSHIADDDDSDEEAIELENVMSYLAEEGEQAALQHRRQYSIDEDNDDKDDKDEDDQEGVKYANAIDLTMKEVNKSAKTNTKTKTKRRGKFPVSEYASRAVHYLESILPKNIGNERDDDDAVASPDDASDAEDFWSESGISTLGLKNDTLEYGLSTDGGVSPNKNLDHDGAGLLRNVDMMSLSSLNEILDGGGTISDKKNQLENNNCLNGGVRRRRQLIGEPSPRAAVQEIGIPRKKKIIGPPLTQPKHSRAGILGLMTPKSAQSCNHSNKQHQVVDVDNNNNKKWSIFFKTPRASDGVPSQLNLVLEEPEDRSEVESHEESRSSASPNCAGDKGNNLESISSNTSNPLAAERLVQADSDSYLRMPEANRYAPAFVDEESKDKCGSKNRYRPIPQDNEIELKLSVATPEDQNSENQGGNDDATLSGNVVKLQSSSSQAEEESKANGSIEEARNDLRVSSDDKSDDHRSRDRYQTEPVGKTPRRNVVDMEENTNRKAKEEERGIQEEPSIQIQFEHHAVLTAKKEEQGDEKVESNLNEKATVVKKTTANKGISCDPIEKSNPNSKTSIQDDAKLRVADKCEEVAVKGNDEKKIAHNNLKPAVLPNKNDNRKKKTHTKSKIQMPEHEEMSKAESEGSKSKIFGRVVDMIALNKRKPLVPITVVEEKYFVDKDMKKISTGVHHIHESRKPTKMNARPKGIISENDTQPPVLLSKPTVGQRAKAISKMKKTPINSSLTLVDDSTTVVRNAISNGNLKAVESNEEGDDVVPLNYLSVMLRKKLYEEKVKARGNYIASETGEYRQQRSSGEKLDADSFVAAIRGPRHKEAPGVALEEIAIRNYPNNRDPTIGNGSNTVIIDLAPTPRRLEGNSPTLNDYEDEAKNKIHDPPMKEEENERQRRKMITERLFQAGSSSFEGETMTNKETSGDVIKTAPTVASAESYCEDPVQEHVNPVVESNANKGIIERKEDHDEPHSRTKLGFGRGRRILSISFLTGSNKRK